MLERNGFLSLVLLAALSCGDEPAPEVEVEEELTPITDLRSGAQCPDDNTLTWESFGKQFMTDYCVRCHTSTRQGDDRLAPPGADFDIIEPIREMARQIDSLAAAGPKASHSLMPPEAPLPAMSEREKLGHWLACGAPRNGTTRSGD